MNSLPEQYTVVVTSNEEFNEVLLFLDSKVETHHLDNYEEYKQTEEYYVIKHNSDWSYNSYNNHTSYKVYTFSQWKSLIEQKEMVDPNNLKDYNGYKYVAHIENKEQWDAVKAYCPSLSSYSSNNKYYLCGSPGCAVDRSPYEHSSYNIIEFSQINFPTQQNMKSKFSVSGSKHLKKAFIEELKEKGYKPNGVSTESSICNHGSAIEPMVGKVYSAGNLQAMNYVLPEDWVVAIKAFEDFNEEEWKVGDWFVYDAYGNITTRQIATINRDRVVVKDGGIFKLTELKNGLSDYKGQSIRRATKEEIVEATKPKEKVVRMNQSEGKSFELIVRKGSVYYEPDNYTFTSANINDLERYITQTYRVGKYNFQPTYFTWGCKEAITLASLKLLITVYRELNG